MHFNRPAAKAAAKESLRLAKPSPILVTLAFLFVVGVLALVVAYAVGGDVQITVGGDVFYTVTMREGRLGGATAGLLQALWWIFSSLAGFGYLAYTLYVSRRQAAGWNDLLLGFSDAARVIVLTLLETVFILLWSLLFVIPGIMAAYSYRLAPYILLDDPDVGAREAIARSKRLMYGHRMELFVCDLSFLGWAILSGLTCGILGLWVTPYKSAVTASFYDTLVYGGGQN